MQFRHKTQSVKCKIQWVLIHVCTQTHDKWTAPTTAITLDNGCPTLVVWVSLLLCYSIYKYIVCYIFKLLSILTIWDYRYTIIIFLEWVGCISVIMALTVEVCWSHRTFLFVFKSSVYGFITHGIWINSADALPFVFLFSVISLVQSVLWLSVCLCVHVV